MELSSVDVKNSCRTCLLPSINLESLFSFHNENDSSLQLARILMSCVPISISQNDGLSENICDVCKSSTISAYKFQQTCISSDRHIRNLIDKEINKDIDLSSISNIKTEKGLESDGDDPGKIEPSLAVTIINNDLSSILENSEEIQDSDDFDEQSSISNYNSDGGDSGDSSGKEADTSITDDKTKKNKSRRYECEFCEKEFKSSSKLARHIKQQHKKSKKEEDESGSDSDEDKNRRYDCADCTKTFKKPSLLARHVKVHDPSKRPHECVNVKCQKRFPTQVALVRHEILHSDLVERSTIARTEPQDFVCVVCPRSFKSPDALSAHIKAHKPDVNLSEYNCRICNEVFVSLHDLVKHSKNHIENATHQCVLCNRLLTLGDELIDHMLRHKGLKPHTCPTCDKSFLKLHKLNVHMRTHSDDRPFLCPECGKSLSTNENLKRHLIRHSGVKPFGCILCPSRFVFKSGLTSHMSTHTGLKPFVCDVCGSSFTKSSSLTKHHRIHTGERPYVCEVCGMRFNSSDHVKRHMRTHTGERPYSCQFCSRSYAQSNDLLKHTRIHVGENTYKCHLCQQAFRLQAQLREHYRSHYDMQFQEDMEMKPLMGTSTDGLIPMGHLPNMASISAISAEHNRAREAQMQHFAHYEMVKNETKESQEIMDHQPDDQKSYHDLSIAKKQKLE